MEKRYYFGKQGEYGPYRKQFNGWPHEGDVMRDFREKQGISPETMARLYGEALSQLSEKERPARTQFTARWICKMESENQVPVDFTRRRVLLHILNIPPALLGLASLPEILPQSLAEMLSGPVTVTPPSAPAALKDQPSISLDTYTQQIRAFWMLNETSQAHDILDLVLTTIEHLEALEKSSAGTLQRHVRELLFSHYRLAYRVYCDMMELPSAYHYANLTVRVAKHLERNDLIAAALTTRAHVRRVWGLHGSRFALHGVIEPNHEKLTESLRDYEKAFSFADAPLQGQILLTKSRVQSLLSGSATDITLATKTMYLAENLVRKEEKGQSPYDNLLLYGAPSGFNEEDYLIGRTLTLNAIGRSDLALETIEDLEKMDSRKRRGKDQTRHHAWVEVVEAQTYLQAKEYPLATNKALNAFLVLRDIRSLDNLAPLQVIVNRLLESPYRNHKDVKKLAQMLTSFYQAYRGKSNEYFLSSSD